MPLGVNTLGVDDFGTPTKSQTDLAGSEDSYLYRSRSLSHCIGERMELARATNADRSKNTSWRLTVFPRNWRLK
jgi:hypothetical protein